MVAPLICTARQDSEVFRLTLKFALRGLRSKRSPIVSWCPRSRRWRRDREVTPRIADQAFDFTLVVALGRAAELIGEQVVEKARVFTRSSPPRMRATAIFVLSFKWR